MLKECLIYKFDFSDRFRDLSFLRQITIYIYPKQVKFIKTLKELHPWYQIYILFGYLITQIP
jgi:hypothetical protein